MSLLRFTIEWRKENILKTSKMLVLQYLLVIQLLPPVYIVAIKHIKKTIVVDRMEQRMAGSISEELRHDVCLQRKWINIFCTVALGFVYKCSYNQ